MKIALLGASGTTGSQYCCGGRGRVAIRSRATPVAAPAAGRRHGGDRRLPDQMTVKEAAAIHRILLSATRPSRTGESHEPWLAAVAEPCRPMLSARGPLRGRRWLAARPDGTCLLDSPGFPPEYAAMPVSGAAALYVFRAAPGPTRLDLRVCPAPVIARASARAHYLVALDTPAGDGVSVEDYAVALAR